MILHPLPVNERPLDAVDRKEWANALRSGHFNQGIETLYDRRNDTFCCLGVAAVILDEVEPEQIDMFSYLNDWNPYVAKTPTGCQFAASELNDDLKLSFEQIADLLDPPHDDFFIDTEEE